MMYVLGGLVVLLFLGSMGLVNQRDQARGVAALANTERNDAEAERDAARRDAENALVPLLWAWNELEEAATHSIPKARLRHFTGTAIGSIQALLDLDDDEMGELVATCPDAPRRLPKYPQFPRALATPEDVAGVPTEAAMQGGGLTVEPTIQGFEPGDRFPERPMKATTQEAFEDLHDALHGLRLAIGNEAYERADIWRDRWRAAWKLDLDGPWTDHWPETPFERIGRALGEALNGVARAIAFAATLPPDLVADVEEVQKVKASAESLGLGDLADRVIDAAATEAKVSGVPFRSILWQRWNMATLKHYQAEGYAMSQAVYRPDSFVRWDPADFVTIHGEHGGAKLQGIRPETWRDRLADLWYRRSVR